MEAALADVFIEAAMRRGVQIIFESHSEHLLLRLQRRIAEEKLPADAAALYFCDIQEGRSQLTELDLDLFGNITNWPAGFFGTPFEDMAAITRSASRRSRR